MSGEIKAAGSKLYIGGYGVLESEAAWVEIGNITNMGELIETFTKITYSVLSEAEDRYEKGSKGTADMTVEMVRKTDDDGQADLKAAAADNTTARDYNFKLEWGPTPTATGATPPISTFKAKVGDFRDPMIGTVNDMVRASSTLWPKTNSIAYAAPTP